VLGTGAIQIVLRRTLNDDEMNEWIRLEELVSQVQLTRGGTKCNGSWKGKADILLGPYTEQ